MERLELSNESLALSVLPECGGKIVSCRSLSSGREWLWKNPYLKLRRPNYGESFIEKLDFGGWDEICPSVAPLTLELEDGFTANIPDHGDLVSLPWTVHEATEHSIDMSAEGRSLPFHFKRVIRSTGTGFELSYQISHTGTQALPWLWCAHPLIAIEPGMRILWRDAHQAELVSLVVPDPESADFSPLAEKSFTEKGMVSAVEIRPSGSDEHLGLNFDSAEIPYLGLWINFAGWSGCGSDPYFNLGIEPATAPFDDLSKAMDAGVNDSLLPGHSVRWKLAITA